MRNTARGLVKGTAEVGGDVGAVTRGAIEGAIDTGALRGAREVGETAVGTVTGVLETTISGVKVVAEAPFKKKDDGAEA